jgi:hypothetical protein
MRKVLVLLAGAAVLWVPAVSVAGDSSSRPSTLAAKPRTSPSESVSKPASTCKSKRNDQNLAGHNGQTLNGSHGRSAGANAFGKCVSAVAKRNAQIGGKHSTERPDGDSQDPRKNRTEEDSSDERHTNSPNPAWTCKAMEANALSQFQAAYGTSPNAFGKCVSGHAHGKRAGG